MTTLPTPTAGTPQATAAYYAQFLDDLPGTYQGSSSQYVGMTWGQLYLDLAKTASPSELKPLAEQVLDWYDAQALGSTVAVEATAAGQDTAAAAQGSIEGLDQFGQSVSNPLDFLGEIGDFFYRLTEKNTYVRLAKMVVGGLLIIVGLAHITGAGNAVASTARKVPLPV